MGRRILTDAGYEVITVNNGSAALKKIAEHKPDLIVLDVYMPGYGGLEVCNRLKEARETARIPVLLTVGKLEPFKPDEARRVRADAFLIKPFEASELLTALTKLEDKIVPQAQPHKPGRFAKALASIEATDAGEAFGDSETGWKDRLSIPHAPVKSRPPETHEEKAMKPADLGRGEDFKPSESRFERPIPAGLPADITPEEIAAITAAAATISGKEEKPAESPEAGIKSEPVAVEAVSAVPASSEVSAAETSTAEMLVATLASSAEPAEAAPAEKLERESPAAAQAGPVSPAAATEAAPAQVEVFAAQVPVMETGTSEAEVKGETVGTEVKAEPAVVSTSASDKPWERDAEVLAAIASLAPSAVETAGGNGAGERNNEEALAVAAVGRASGSRWVAEAVALAEEDPAVNLELEIEKMYASEAARQASLETAAAASASPKAQVAVAEVSLVPPAGGGSAEPPAAQTSTTAVGSGEAAYAAAASTGSTSETTPVAEVVTPSAPAEPVRTAEHTAEPGEKMREAEMAAAWENWKQIREAIVGDEFASHIAQAAAEELEASQAEAGKSSETGQQSADRDDAGDEATGDSDEPAAIASIVDSVLAELKPKLVEEIARKMNSDKKAKAKKSKK
jgi:CheY-like chemotaxis protein